MEFDAQDQDIINLLMRLKDVPAEYPEHMRVARRRFFLKQMTTVGLGIGPAAGIKNALGKVKPPKISPFTGLLLEAALVAAIVVEASAMAYFYRDKVLDFFQTIKTDPKIEEVTTPPALPTSLEAPGVSPSHPASATPVTEPAMIPATEPVVVMVTPTGTPVPGNTLEANQSSSTPDPKGNNGNHYGQTPKPERTKENNGNNDNNGNNGNPDKDPKPTKDR